MRRLLVCALVLAGCSSGPGPDSGIRGEVLYGPVCPVETDPPQEDCADRPYETELAVMTEDGEDVVELFGSDADGSFEVRVEPGRYVIRSVPGSQQPPSCSTQETVVVEEDRFTETTVHCDSGIR
jgi:hypothetical protein